MYGPGGTGFQSYFAKIEGFLKYEKLDFEAKDWNPVVRLISPRNPRYGAELGPYLRRAEPEVVAGLGRLFGHRVVMKGQNADATGQIFSDYWDLFDEPCYVGLDAKRWDQHMGERVLTVEHGVYLAMFSGDSHLQRLLSLQLNNKIRMSCTEGDVYVTHRGARMSGDFNTGVGNCMVACLVFWSVARLLGLRKFRFVNNGDDCGIFLERADLPLLEGLHEAYRGFGFYMVIEEPVTVLEQCSFCQTQPVWVDGHYRMVRDPRVVLEKDLLTTKPITSERVWRRLFGAIGECGLSLSSGIPVLQSFYRSMPIGSRSDMEQCGMRWLSTGMESKILDITPETRDSFERAFGMPEHVQILLERFYDSVVHSYERPRDYQYTFNPELNFLLQNAQ